MDYLIYAAIAIAGYLFGSLSFAIIIGKLFYNTDVRQHGSKSAGATNVKCELGTIVFDGKVVDAMYVSSEMAGFHLQQLAVMRKTGNHIATIGITTTDKDRLQEILDMFYELD